MSRNEVQWLHSASSGTTFNITCKTKNVKAHAPVTADGGSSRVGQHKIAIRQVEYDPARVTKRADPTIKMKEKAADAKIRWHKAKNIQGHIRIWWHEFHIRQVMDHPARVAKRADPTIQMKARGASASATWHKSIRASEVLVVVARSQHIKEKSKDLALCCTFKSRCDQATKERM